MPLRFSPSRGAASLALNSLARGPAGPGGITGGVADDFLIKNSSTNYDASWQTATQVRLILGIDTTLRRVTGAGAITVSATTDQRIHVAKTVEAATVLNLPTVAARIAAVGRRPYFIKNEMSNGALYPLTPTPSGSEKIEGVAGAYTMDSQRQGHWFWPDDSVSPANWEIR